MNVLLHQTKKAEHAAVVGLASLAAKPRRSNTGEIYMHKRYILLVFALLQIFLITGYAQDVSSETIQELKERADAILSHSDVSARREIDVVFQLADRLLEIKEINSAENYLNKGLQHNPWDLEHQIIYANLLKTNGMKAASTEKANLVLKYAEGEDLIEKAKLLLDIPPTPDFKNIQRIEGTNHCVVLIPLQRCQKWLISKMQTNISETLEIPVYIQRIKAEYPTPSRDLRGQILNRIRRQIEKEGNKDPQVTFSMKQLNLNMADLKRDEIIVRLMEHILPANGPNAVEQFKSALKDAEGKNPQWNTDELQSLLFKSIAPYRRENVAYLGITSEDIYANDYNFLFGWANAKGGVMSYHRFTAIFNDELPNQDRLLKRAQMQALSSIGHIFGVKRCTNPTCARAYPNNLSEHDAKEGSLCTQCVEGFKKLFEQKH